MKMKKFALTIICCLSVSFLLAQEIKDYDLVHFTSDHTAFPDTGRINGHIYDSVLYNAKDHYSDNHVLMIIPKKLKTNKTVDLVFWFHGWRNNIDRAAEFYKLTRQFIASKRNAVLVLAETAKNSPDSYGGKLEQPGMFRLLTNDVMQALKAGNYISDQIKPGNIVLAGHSGAFRVIAYILQNGEMPVQEVFLFDALYAEVDKYQNWIELDRSHHFVHWFTNHGGGTDEVSSYMMTQLKNHSDNFELAEEAGIKPKTINDNYILFVHSLREHNVIINDPDNFQLLLENSFVLRQIK
jgi:hypothetical protein